MKIMRQSLALPWFVLLVFLTIPYASLSQVDAAPLSQDPPSDSEQILPELQLTLPRSQEPQPPGGNSGNGGPPGARCASVQGQVINWGVGGVSGVSPKVSTGSWELSATSDTSGNYNLGGLGVGVATLQVTLPPALQDQLTPLIQGAGVYLNCDYPLIANIALYSSSAIEPPATIEVTGPEAIVKGDEIPIRLTVKNDLPNEITNVVVTSLMPPNLKALSVEGAAIGAESVDIVDAGADGQLVSVFLDRVSSGEELNLFVTVTPAGVAPPGSELTLTATLFYRESAADQASMDVTIREEGPSFPELSPEVVAEAEMQTSTPTLTASTTATATPVVSATPAASVESEDETVPPNDMPQTGDHFVAPPELLPVTGQVAVLIPATLPNTGIDLLLPIGGVALSIVVLVVHGIRSTRKNNP